MADIARIEERIDRVAAGAVEVSDALGGLRFQNMTEVMEFSKLLSVSDKAVPPHLRGNPGMCLAVCVQALEWRFSPFAVANKSYVVSDRIAYESQLVHAVIEQRAPITGRLRHRYEGEGDDRRCIVSAILRETGEPLEYISPPIGKITPKNSPLWKTKADLQLYYNTSRDFCRVYFPDVLLGVYSEDELRDHVGPENAKDVSDKPDVASRLKGGKGRGFNKDHVDQHTRGVIDESTEQAPAQADAGATGTASAPSNSSEPSAPRPPAQAKPAPATDEESAKGAGTTQSPDAPAEQRVPSGEERQATESGAPALHDSAGLPDSWAKDYAAALGKVAKIGSLSRVAAAFWNERGGYERIKADAPTFEKAESIYAAFRDFFGEAKKAEREAALKELGAFGG